MSRSVSIQLVLACVYWVSHPEGYRCIILIAKLVLTATS